MRPRSENRNVFDVRIFEEWLEIIVSETRWEIRYVVEILGKEPYGSEKPEADRT
jgi:hypothetical protein